MRSGASLASLGSGLTSVAARATNDNLLDIIDIVQGDQALAASAGNSTGNPGHDGGFAEQPGYLAGTITHFQDNQAQTDFWSAFIAGANNINNALTAEANGTTHLDTAGLSSLIQQVKGYEQLGASFDGNLRKADLQEDGPYNTYTRAGLPPTPIAMPGLPSIHAALHPADTKALYYVAKGDGSSQFSRNIEEHNKAVSKYLLHRK